MASPKPKPKEAPSQCLLDRPLHNPVPAFLKAVTSKLLPQNPKEQKK